MSNQAQGLLQVNVFTASGALPVENATVKVKGSEEGNGNIEFSVLTNTDGSTAKIPLPTPPREYSLSPENKSLPYSAYDIVITKENFYTRKINGIPMFEGVDAVLPVELIPLSYNADGNVQDSLNNATVEIYENQNLIY